jgi:hypothetical protein
LAGVLVQMVALLPDLKLSAVARRADAVSAFELLRIDGNDD